MCINILNIYLLMKYTHSQRNILQKISYPFLIFCIHTLYAFDTFILSYKRTCLHYL